MAEGGAFEIAKVKDYLNCSASKAKTIVEYIDNYVGLDWDKYTQREFSGAVKDCLADLGI